MKIETDNKRLHSSDSDNNVYRTNHKMSSQRVEIFNRVDHHTRIHQSCTYIPRDRREVEIHACSIIDADCLK